MKYFVIKIQLNGGLQGTTWMNLCPETVCFEPVKLLYSWAEKM